MNDGIATLDTLYPADAFFCARTTRKMMAWNVADADGLPQYRLDATPAQLIGFAGDMPFIAHEAAATRLAMEFVRHCGLPGANDLHTYCTEHDATEIAQQLINAGGKLVHNFGTLPALEDNDGLLVSMADYLRFNSKASLELFVEPANLPARQLVRVDDLETLLAVKGCCPAFIKTAEEVSTGGGAGVWHCGDITSIASVVDTIKKRISSESQLVIEADCAPLHSWCTGVSILDDGVTWLGASRQIFRSPARQTGNEMSDAAPNDIKSLALDIAERARSAGYRGVAGFDIGELANAAPVVFDLNFRPNSSTGLLLAGAAAIKHTGLPLARSFFLRHDGPLAELLDGVEAEAASGRIIPGSLFDGETHRTTNDDAVSRSCLDGWVLAETSDQAVAFSKSVAAKLKT